MAIAGPERFENAVYVGRTDDGLGVSFYYVGQAKDPARRWDQHLQRGTGPCAFGYFVRWAVLAWGIPDGKLDAVESYLIGYVLSRFGCVNGNRGNDDGAFTQGFRDAASGMPPAVCPDVKLDALDWQEFRKGSADYIVNNRIEPSAKADVWERYWGFHTLDKSVVIEPFLTYEKERLQQELNAHEILKLKLEDAIATTQLLWFMFGAIIGAVLAYLCFK